MSDFSFQRNAKITITDTVIKDSFELIENKIEFKVEKSINSFPNLSEIKITNPSEDFVNFSKRENLKIDLETGYFEEELDILFTGDLKRAYYGNPNVDNVFVIEAGDSEKGITEAFLSKSYINKVQKRTIVKDCINLLDIDILTTTLNKITGTYNGGFVAFERCVDILNIVLGSLGFEWSIQNNQLLISTKGETNNIDFFELSYESGLIDKPVELQDGGLLLKAHIDTKFIPHKTVSLNVEGFEGFYQIRQAIMNGDNEEGMWEGRLIVE